MRILIAAYTVLAIAAGARAAVQLATRAGDAPVPYALSALAAAVYLTLAVALRRRGRWRKVAVAAATAELLGVLCVGTAEHLSSTAWPDETVWSGFGAGYGWAPLILPVAALVLLARGGSLTPGAQEVLHTRDREQVARHHRGCSSPDDAGVARRTDTRAARHALRDRPGGGHE